MKKLFLLFVLSFLFLSVPVAHAEDPTAVPTATATVTTTSTPTVAPTSSATPVVSPTVSPSAVASVSPKPTVKPTVVVKTTSAPSVSPRSSATPVATAAQNTNQPAVKSYTVTKHVTGGPGFFSGLLVFLLSAGLAAGGIYILRKSPKVQKTKVKIKNAL